MGNGEGGKPAGKKSGSDGRGDLDCFFVSFGSLTSKETSAHSSSTNGHHISLFLTAFSLMLDTFKWKEITDTSAAHHHHW